MIGLIIVFLVSLVGALLAMVGMPNFLEMDFVAWLSNLFGIEEMGTLEMILWPAVVGVALVLAVMAALVSAKNLNRSMETEKAKKLTTVSCLLYALLVIPCAFLVKSLIIVGTGSITAFWILFLFATLDAIVFVGVSGRLNAKAEKIDREALDAANA